MTSAGPMKVLSITVRKGFPAQKSNQRESEAGPITSHKWKQTLFSNLERTNDLTAGFKSVGFGIILPEFKFWSYHFLNMGLSQVTTHFVSQLQHLYNGDIKMIVKNKNFTK